MLMPYVEYVLVCRREASLYVIIFYVTDAKHTAVNSALHTSTLTIGLSSYSTQYVYSPSRLHVCIRTLYTVCAREILNTQCK